MFHRIALVILIFISSFSVHAESIIALSDGDGIQKGDKILEISQTKDPSLKEFLDAIDKAKKIRTNVYCSPYVMIFQSFVVVDIDEITTLFLPISSKLSNCPSSTTYWHNCFGTDNYPSGCATLVSGKMAKSMDRAFSYGPMEMNTLVSGKMAKSMDRAPTPTPAVPNTSVSG